MSKSSTTCTECGARLAENATRCDLCGAEVVAAEPRSIDEANSDVEVQGEAPEPSAPGAETSGGVFCNECGWKNPPGARFCSQCGTKLQDLTGATPAVTPEADAGAGDKTKTPPRKTKSVDGPIAPAADKAPAKTTPEHPASESGKDSQQTVSRQVGIIIGVGALLVVALFLITAVSKDGPAPETTNTGEVAAQPDAPPLPPEVAARVDELRSQIAQSEGEARQVFQTQLVNMVEGAGRLDLAAIEQRKIAQEQDTPDAWRRAGDLFYDWMNIVEGARKTEIAEQAISAYQTVLEEQPDNLDVKTDMAVSYLNSGDPMQGVTLIKEVIETDSTHVTARFNYGAMLAMIGRTEQALSEFEAVKRLNSEESPYYERADAAIKSIRARIES